MTSRHRIIASLLCVAPALVAGCASAPSVQAPAVQDAASYVLTLGIDTLSAESYTRTGDRIEGVVMRRSPRTTVTRYVMQLGPTGMPTRLDYTTRLPDGSMVPNGARSVAVTFRGDSAITEIQRDTMVQRRVAARSAYPEIDGAVSWHRFAIDALRASGRDSATLQAYVAGAAGATDYPVARRAANRWWVYSFGSPIEITTDDAGRILNVDASRTTFRIQARRQPPMDVAALAARFAERERTAGALVLSPRDSASARIGDASITIAYGRPSARGRRIWGPTGVLGDSIWRTGANAATQLRTSAPMLIGGRELPAGTYVVTTLAIPGRYQLILSQNNAEVLRVALTSRELTQRVEQFTVLLEPTGDRSGVLRLRWDTMELSAPIALR